MIEWIQQIDGQALIFFNSLHTPFFDIFMMMATGRFTWVPFYAFIIAMLIYRFGLRRAVFCILVVALLILITDQVCATVLRPTFRRLRPSHPENPLSNYITFVDGYRAGRYGFPSSHAGNTFALATYLSLLCRRRVVTITIFCWAILHTYTRLYLGVHFVGDVLAGATLGVFFAATAYLLTRRLRQRFPAQPIPLPFAPGWMILWAFLAETAVLNIIAACRL